MEGNLSIEPNIMCFNAGLSRICRIYAAIGCSQRFEVGAVHMDLCDIVRRLHDGDIHDDDDSQNLVDNDSGNQDSLSQNIVSGTINRGGNFSATTSRNGAEDVVSDRCNSSERSEIVQSSNFTQMGSDSLLHGEQLMCGVDSNTSNKFVVCAVAAFSSPSKKCLRTYKYCDQYVYYVLHPCMLLQRCKNFLKENHELPLMVQKLVEREGLGPR